MWSVLKPLKEIKKRKEKEQVALPGGTPRRFLTAPLTSHRPRGKAGRGERKKEEERKE